MRVQNVCIHPIWLLGWLLAVYTGSKEMSGSVQLHKVHSPHIPRCTLCTIPTCTCSFWDTVVMRLYIQSKRPYTSSKYYTVKRPIIVVIHQWRGSIQSILYCMLLSYYEVSDSAIGFPWNCEVCHKLCHPSCSYNLYTYASKRPLVLLKVDTDWWIWITNVLICAP